MGLVLFVILNMNIFSPQIFVYSLEITVERTQSRTLVQINRINSSLLRQDGTKKYKLLKLMFIGNYDRSLFVSDIIYLTQYTIFFFFRNSFSNSMHSIASTSSTQSREDINKKRIKPIQNKLEK